MICKLMLLSQPTLTKQWLSGERPWARSAQRVSNMRTLIAEKETVILQSRTCSFHMLWISITTVMFSCEGHLICLHTDNGHWSTHHLKWCDSALMSWSLSQKSARNKIKPQQPQLKPEQNINIAISRTAMGVSVAGQRQKLRLNARRGAIPLVVCSVVSPSSLGFYNGARVDSCSNNNARGWAMGWRLPVMRSYNFPSQLGAWTLNALWPPRRDLCVQ